MADESKEFNTKVVLERMTFGVNYWWIARLQIVTDDIDVNAESGCGDTAQKALADLIRKLLNIV